MAVTSFSMSGMNQTRIRTLVTLNRVCIVHTLYSREVLMTSAFELSVRSAVLGSGRPKSVTMLPTRWRKNGKMHRTQNTPNRLKTVCEKAVRLAATLPTEAAMLAAIVVPIFSPRIIAAARRKGMTPVVTRIMMMAIVAAEDWKQTVITILIIRKMAIDQPPRSVQACTKPSFSGVMSTCAVARSCAKPMKKRQKPMMISPMSLVFCAFLPRSRKPTRKSGKAKSAMLKEKPNTAMIQEVTVVPMFAPMITPMACPSTSSPALTKLTTRMVVAVEDWMAAVTPIPVMICLKGLEVIEARNERSPSPATF